MKLRIPTIRLSLSLVSLFGALGFLALAGLYGFAAYMGQDVQLWQWVVAGLGFCLSLGFAVRHVLKRLAAGGAGLLIDQLRFPMAQVRDQVWGAAAVLSGAGLLYVLYQLAVSRAGQLEFVILGVALTVLVVSGLVKLLTHRLAGVLSIGVGLVLLASGILLLHQRSQQVDAYNRAMDAIQEGDYANELKHLDESLAAYERDRMRSQLARLVMPEPPSYLAARAHFHKGNLYAQTPNKGRQAYEELAKSLAINPGNHIIGLTAQDAVIFELDARRAQRNLEKLIKSGQSGGQGMPHGKQGQGQQQQPGEKRDPGRDPAPGAGRMPRNIL